MRLIQSPCLSGDVFSGLTSFCDIVVLVAVVEVDLVVVEVVDLN